MPIRLSGLSSGLDTDTIVSALVSAYSYKKDTITKKQTKLSWTQDAWKSLNTKVYGLYSNVSNLRFSSAYNLKKTTASDTTKATVSASNSAVNGTQKLNILKVAQSGYLTGGKLASGTNTSTTLAELGYTGGDASINVDRGDGTSKTITVSNTSTVNDVINQLKDAGLNASLDSTNGRLFVSAKDTGTASDFNLIGVDANGMSALSKLGLSTSLYTTDANGNKVATATGATYESYAAYATDDSGNILSESATRAKIADAAQTYADAVNTKARADAQVTNLKGALAYGTAYSAVQDFYSENGFSGDAKAQLDSVMGISASDRGKAVVANDGTLYTATSAKDTNGNTVYSRTDEEGNTSYISREVTYTLDDKTYRKNTDGKYVNVADEADIYSGDTTELVKDENQNVSYYTVNENISYSDGDDNTYNVQSRTVTGEDGNDTTEYYFVKDGKEYTASAENGDFTYTDGDGNESRISITKKYEYQQGAATSGLHLASELYDGYVGQLTDEENGVDKTAAKKLVDTFATNLATVNSYEKSASDTEDVALPDGSANYTKNSLITSIQNAYASGGADEVKSYLNTDVASAMTDLSSVSADAQSAIESDSTISTLGDITYQLSQLDADSEDEAVQSRIASLQSQYNEKLSNMTSTAIAAAQTIQNGDTEGSAVKVDGQDAEIKLNGVTYTGTSNSFSINGLNITAQGVTGDGDDNAITVTTATDVQGMYDKIKDFLTEYNSIINEITKLYNADSAKGYEPLTDDEKEAMSDSEVEKWETKIKDSLLRNDGTLNGIMTSMTSAMSGAIEVNGKRYSLSSFGISTLGFLNSAQNEQNAYHIDGDEDDTNTSGKKDKLMAMLTSDPDTVTEFFQKLSSNLYESLGDKMKSTSLSSIYTIYNDKQMSNQYKDYTKLIKQWEDKISAKEDYYYNKFSSMESSLAKLQSTQSSLAGYFGS